MKPSIKHILLLLCLLYIGSMQAEYTFNVGGELNLGAGSSEFAPFYLHSNRHGKLTQAKNVQLDIWAIDSLDVTKRFDFSWGLEVVGGYANKANYARYSGENNFNGQPIFYANPLGPSAIWIQQLFGEVKWRCLFLSLGLKDRDSWFVDQQLSSGDLLWSGNSRGIPEARIGFIDFQNIPFTNGWVQIDACISYGKFMDDKWQKNHFDYYTGKISTGNWWTYKRIALRTKPSKPFSFQFGFQMAGIFNGITTRYDKGNIIEVTDNNGGFKNFLLMLWPLDTQTREGNKTGDHKGTWDVVARYRFKHGETLRAYTQWFWEDGSSLLKENGWDGLWGLEFKLNRRWWVSGAVVEYLDLTNMSGPLSYEPNYDNDKHGATLPYRAHGCDGYYNNFFYRSYVNYGLNMATPMVQGILFNTGMNGDLLKNDGSIPYFRVRAIHLAVEGSIGPYVDYIVKYNHRKAWGLPTEWALIRPVEGDSFMVGATYLLPQVPGLTVSASLGIDKGNIPGNAVGGMVTLTYERPITFRENR